MTTIASRKNAPHSKDSRVVFGDPFTEREKSAEAATFAAPPTDADSTVALRRRLASTKKRLAEQVNERQDASQEEEVWRGTGARLRDDATAVDILQRWDGVVVDVGEETFRARLLDEATGRPQLEADIYISDVAEHDRPLLKHNGIFYWYVGYRDPHGDRERISKIRFRRLPPKTEADLKRAEHRASERRKLLGWN
jgi:hypothetical protein